MTWSRKITNKPIYEWAGTNQHGDRYKRVGSEQITTARLESHCKNAFDLRTLILLGHELNVPVHYNYTDGTAYIEVVSAETV